MFRLSNYNYFVPYQDKMIYFNGISNKVFSLNLKEHEKIQVLFKDLISFEINYTSVFNQFRNWGFIVDENEDEIALLRFRNHQAIYTDRNYRLFINPTLECNFACWYCYEKHSQGYMSEDTISKIKKHLNYMVEEVGVESISIGWFGGEPLLYFDEVVYQISLHAKELCEKWKIPFYNTITTNASKINEEMVERIREINFSRFQITIDGDEKRHNRIRNENGQPSFQLIMRNIRLLLERLENVSVILRVNYDDQTLQQCDMMAIFESIPAEYRHKVSVNFQRVWQTSKNDLGKNEKRLDLYAKCRELGFYQYGVSNAFYIGETHKCYADRLFYGEINYDGKVFRCTARGYDDRYVMGELMEDGRIKWDEKKMAHCLGKATFDNEMCLPCKYLPLCLGPCSQKVLETPKKDLRNVCSLNGCEVSPEEVIIEYYNRKVKILSQEVKF